jgi:signal transduction histidine kinase
LLILDGVHTAKAYEAERRRLLWSRTWSACILATVLVPLFATADYFMFREHFGVMLAARIFATSVGAGSIVLLRTSTGRHFPGLLGGAVVLAAGFAVGGVPVVVTGTDTPHYVGITLLILSASAVLPWRPIQVAVVTAVLTAMFIGAGLIHGSLPDAIAFSTQVSAILITGVIGISVSTFAESTRRREFTARRELKRASKEKTQLIQNLEKMTGRLATANEDLQERQRETNDFLYVLSHDLRAPLINIQGFGKRLHTDMSGLEGGLVNGSKNDSAKRLERMQQSLQFLNAGTAKIDQLISRLLEVARLSTRPRESQWVDADHLAHEVVDSCRFQLEANGVEVTIGNLPRVWGDPVQLSQVFTNLVDNAIKYMGASPKKRIDISCSTQGERYRFAVSDTGPGIASKDQEKVFRLFARLGANGTSGEGVGLATVRAIVNRHGGRIWVESTPGDGCTFYFTLPRAMEEPVGAGTRASAAMPTLRGEEVGVHV